METFSRRPLTRSYAKHFTKLSELTSAKSILNQDCLLIIFRCLKLEKLIYIRSVCRQWKCLTEYVCRGQRSLKLNVCSGLNCCHMQFSVDALYREDNLDAYLDDRSHFANNLFIREEHFKVSLCKTLPQLFPELKKLSIDFDSKVNSTNLNRIGHFLKHWSGLSHFAVFIRSGPKNMERLLPTLYEAIDRNLIRLRRLDIFVDNMFSYTKHHPVPNHEINLSRVLPHLEGLSIKCSTASLVPVFSKLGPNLKYLNLGLSFFTLTKLNTFIKSPNLALNQITTLKLIYYYNSELLELICQHFTSLKYLQIGNARTSSAKIDSDFLNSLNKLKHLEELKVLDYSIDVSCSASLSRVKKLTICTFNLFHRFKRHYCRDCSFDGKLFCSTLASQFPKLEALTIVACLSSKDEQKTKPQLIEHKKLFGSLRKLNLSLHYTSFRRIYSEKHF